MESNIDTTCPACGCVNVSPVTYGYGAGGGCTRLDHSPNRPCHDCRHHWLDVDDPGYKEYQTTTLLVGSGSYLPANTDDAAIAMSDPLSFYVAPKGQAPLPVRPVDPNQLRRWAQKTEIGERGPALTVDGAWTVYLESLSPREAAARSRARLEDQGFPITIQTAQVGDKTFYRVALAGFRNWQGAVAFKDGLADDLGFRTAWVVEQ